MDKENREGADKVLQEAQEAIYLDVRPEDVTSFQLDTHTTVSNTSILKDQSETKSSAFKSVHLSSQSTDCLRYQLTTYGETDGDDDNKQVVVSILNEDQVKTDFASVVNGERTNGFPIDKDMPTILKDQFRKIQDNLTQIPASAVRKEIWMSVFAMLLSVPWDSEAKFTYIGKADVDGNDANLIELETDDDVSTTFFFDDETKLLRKIDKLKKADDFEKRSTWHFSDYQKKGGVMIANSQSREDYFGLNDEGGGSFSNIVANLDPNPIGSFEKLFGKFPPYERIKSTEETAITNFEVNPSFDGDTFSV